MRKLNHFFSLLLLSLALCISACERKADVEPDKGTFHPTTDDIPQLSSNLRRLYSAGDSLKLAQLTNEAKAGLVWSPQWKAAFLINGELHIPLACRYKDGTATAQYLESKRYLVNAGAEGLMFKYYIFKSAQNDLSSEHALIKDFTGLLISRKIRNGEQTVMHYEKGLNKESRTGQATKPSGISAKTQDCLTTYHVCDYRAECKMAGETFPRYVYVTTESTGGGCEDPDMEPCMGGYGAWGMTWHLMSSNEYTINCPVDQDPPTPPSAPVADGLYIIRAHNGMVVSVEGNSPADRLADGRKFVMRNYSGTADQKWYFHLVYNNPTGQYVYKISSLNSQKFIDVEWANQAEGTLIHQWPYTNNQWPQYWIVRNLPSGGYYDRFQIFNDYTKQAITKRGDGPNDYLEQRLFVYSNWQINLNSQMWKLEPTTP